jgi:hypothetical protein
MELSAEKYPPEQVMRAQRFQAQHGDIDIRAAAGYFISERRTADGVHIITRPSLGELMDRLEEAGP